MTNIKQLLWTNLFNLNLYKLDDDAPTCSTVEGCTFGLNPLLLKLLPLVSLEDVVGEFDTLFCLFRRPEKRFPELAVVATSSLCTDGLDVVGFLFRVSFCGLCVGVSCLYLCTSKC